MTRTSLLLLLSLVLLAPPAARGGELSSAGGHEAPAAAAADEAPAGALPLDEDERTALAHAQAADAHELAAIRGGIDDHDLTLILGTALVVVIIAILL